MSSFSGHYMQGLYYSTSASGNSNELEELLIVPLSSKDDYHSANRKITFIHENAHYLHDLSLGVCLNRDSILDELAATLFDYIKKNKDLTFPLANDRKIFKSKINKESASSEAEFNKFMTERYSFLDYILYDEVPVSTRSIPNFPNSIEISSIDLLENIAVIKTLFVTSSGVNRGALPNCDISDLPLLPEFFPDSYTLATKLLDSTLGYGRNIERKWLDDLFEKNDRSFLDTAFLQIAEISLHIPPYNYIEQLIEKGKNKLEDFIPALRFVRCIEESMKFGGFPDKSGTLDNYHKELFDWYAEKLGWPSYLDTHSTWAYETQQRKYINRHVADGYKFRALMEKDKNTMGMVHGNHVNILLKNYIPILHETPRGFKLVRAIPNEDGSMSFFTSHFQDLLSPWFLMQQQAIPWSDNLINEVDDIKNEFEPARWLTFTQEIIFRLICRSLQDAICFHSQFCCPFSSGACDVRSEKCTNIKNLADIPKAHCSVRKYTEYFGINLGKLRWR